MLFYSKKIRNHFCGLQLSQVPLAIVKAEGIKFLALCVDNSQSGSGIHTSAKKHYRLFRTLSRHHSINIVTCAFYSISSGTGDIE